MNRTSVTTTRSGRQVETTTTVILDRPKVVGWLSVGVDAGGALFDSVICNERSYDGEVTDTYYWAATDGGTKIAAPISRSDYEEIVAS
jgi:hypothetical protein